MTSENNQCKLVGYIKNHPHSIKCGICSKPYRSPKQLDCGHAFCGACIEDSIKVQNDKEGSFVCPVCKEVNYLPADGFFKDSVFYRSVQNISKLFTKEGTTCSCCDDNKKATVACFSCGEMLCNTCRDAHKKFKVTREHSVCPISELMQAEQLLKFQSMQYSACEDHPGEVKKYYCEDDKAAICGLCVHDDKHTLHVTTSLSVRVEQLGSNIQEMATSCNSQRDELVTSIASIKEKIKAVEVNKEQILREIQDRTLALHEMIDNYMNQITGQLNLQSNEQTDKLEELLQMYCRELNKRDEIVTKAEILTELAVSDILPVAHDLSGPLESMTQSVPAAQEMEGLEVQFPTVEFIQSSFKDDKEPDILPSLAGFVTASPNFEPKSVVILESHLNEKMKDAAINIIGEAYKLYEASPRGSEMYSNMSKYVKDYFDQKFKVRSKMWQCVVGTRLQYGWCLVRHGDNHISVTIDHIVVELFVVK